MTAGIVFLKRPHIRRWVLLAIFFPAALVHADASRCYSIKDKDLRQYCLATAQGRKSRCYAIRDKDQKNLCLAQLGSQKSRCYSIQDKDRKNQCLAGFK